MALGWTALLLVMLLQSSSQPLLGPAAPPGPITLEREILLTIGHIVGFAVLTVLWWWALLPRSSHERALVLAVMVALVIGTFTELAQASVPDRVASVYDLVVNTLAVLVTAWVIRRKGVPLRLLLSQILVIALFTACTLTTVPPITPTPTTPEDSETGDPVFIDARDTPIPGPDGSTGGPTPNSGGQAPDELYIPGCIPRTDWQLYTVKDGDIITNLALLGEITVDELVSANCLANPDLLYVGQQLYVPPVFPPTPEPAG